MEEKINNQKIFNYIPSLIMKLILDNPLKDITNYSFIFELCILIIFSTIFSV